MCFISFMVLTLQLYSGLLNRDFPFDSIDVTGMAYASTVSRCNSNDTGVAPSMSIAYLLKLRGFGVSFSVVNPCHPLHPLLKSLLPHSF